MIRTLMAIVLAFALAFPLTAPAGAVDPDEILDDPQLEERARDISAGLRCLVCQNQSIDDSDAPLAKDLRGRVRERLLAGDSDSEVIDHVVDRYGEFVLLRPRIAPHTYALWLTPPVLLILGVLMIWSLFRRRVAAGAASASSKLSDEEEARLSALMRERDAG